MRPPIYLSGSISGGRDDAELYGRIGAALTRAGWPVVSGDVANDAVSSSGCDLEDDDVWERDLERIEAVARKGGFLVAEISRPSLGVGYEIATARWKYHLQVITLWRPTAWASRCSAMIAGDPDVMLIRYDEQNFDEAMESLLIALERLCDDASAVVNP